MILKTEKYCKICVSFTFYPLQKGVIFANVLRFKVQSSLQSKPIKAYPSFSKISSKAIISSIDFSELGIWKEFAVQLWIQKQSFPQDLKLLKSFSIFGSIPIFNKGIHSSFVQEWLSINICLTVDMK